MESPSDPDRTAIRLAERLIQLLGRGGFTATYKYAVLIGLMDLCMELTGAMGVAPEMITTRQLAEKIIELYWPHCTPYQDHGVLRQNSSKRVTGTGKIDTQAEIVRYIQQFRDTIDSDPAASLPLSRARARAKPGAYERLVDRVEWKLVEYPLPRLQNIGREEDRFLYDYSFGKDLEKAEVDGYQQGHRSSFDNRLNLQPGTGAALIALNGVLRPLIHRDWALMVGRMNRLPESGLERHLFGSERVSLEPVRRQLRELQDDRCFYCAGRIEDSYEIDHFVPWSRHADNSIENLVAADQRCNGNKRDYLADAEHVEHWRERSNLHASELSRIAEAATWESAPSRSLNVTRAIYGMLPGDAKLWHAKRGFLRIETERIRAALAPALAA